MSSWLMATVLVRALIEEGVTDVVLAPGSRSAALAVACEQAERGGLLRLHVRVDERVAGFLALGLAKASGVVAPVICTSGTAVGNLLPSAMEASHAGVPWMALTCDRPAYRIGTGASQTTDQSGILGVFAVANVRLSSSSGRPAYWSSALRRALVAASGERTRRPGPAQVNLEFSNPMLPGEVSTSWIGAGADPLVNRRETGLDAAMVEQGGRVYEASRGRNRCGTPGQVYRLEPGLRTVVVAGDASAGIGAEARAFAELAGLPLMAEPTSNARSGANAIASYRLLLDGPLCREIDRVVTFGHPTLSRPVAALLSDEAVEHIVVTRGADWPDAGATASLVCDGVLLEPADNEWLGRWQRADGELMATLDTELIGLTGYTTAAAVVAASGPNENLVFGSSSPIRDADIAPIPMNPALTWANRGLAGIDGTIATAMGIALATRHPTTLLLGDLTFQHDIGALALTPSEPRPRLRIVVADDNGGSIFHTLEQGADVYADSFERVFGTPQCRDLVTLATGFGAAARTIASYEQLVAALAAPIADIEVLVVCVDRRDRRALDRRLRDLGMETIRNWDRR